MTVLSPASVALAAFMLAALPGAPGARPTASEPRLRPASDSGTWKATDLADRNLCERLAAVPHRAEARIAVPNFTAPAHIHYPAPKLL